MDWQSQIALDAGRTYAADAPVDERLVFLRKTYLLTLLGLGVATVGGWLGATMLLDTVIGLFYGNFLGILLFFAVFYGAFFLAKAVRAKPGVNYLAMFFFTFVAGACFGPLFAAALQVAGGEPTILLQAIVVTGFTITGLSGYVLVTRKDFSFLGGALTMGFFLLIGLFITGFFIHGTGIALAFSGVGALLFAGFTLYDTSRIVRTHPTDDPIGAALDLFLDFFGLFIYILQFLMILAGDRR